MNREPYQAFVAAKNNAYSAALAWIGSVLGPIYISIGWGNYSEWFLYVGVALTVYVLISIKNGFVALKKGVISDFLVYGVAPIAIPILSLIGLVIYSVY